MTRHRARLGFTLFDLVVLLAGGSVGLGLFLPAINRFQETRVRSRSANNLRQIGIGCHAYHDVNGVFPSGVDANGFSASAYVLPYVEQGNLFNLIDFTKAVDAPENAAARATIVKTFLNPRDPLKSVSDDYGATNYLFSAGDRASLDKNNGVFFKNSKLKITDITDGTSNTLMVGETLKGDGGMKAMDMRRQHVLLKKEALAGLKDDAGVKEWEADTDIAADRCASWMDGRFLQGTFTATRKINDDRPDVSCGGEGGWSGLRTLGRGANVAFCDGSVRFATPNVDIKVWRALATRDGGEAVDPGF
jgi:prepilin-type processing-associated H-X9-DG protein